MKIHKEFVTSRGMKQVVFFLWVLIVVAEMSFFFVVHEESRNKQLVKISSRKARFLGSNMEFFHAPPPQVNEEDTKGDPHKVYEDDKRIIHTGPNPLHN